jgi:hypothetical protein
MWHNILTAGNASLGFQWAVLGRDPAVNPNATLNPIFHALKQFFHHVPAGVLRIAAHSDHRDLLVSAFKHLEKNSAQLVLINRATADQQVAVSLQHLNQSTWEAYRTSRNENHIHVGSYRVVNHHLRLTIPAQSVMTLAGRNRAEPIRQPQLWQNYPNPFGRSPFNPETAIGYELRAAAHVKLAIFNLRGEEIAMLVDAEQPAGKHVVYWHGNDDAERILASGIYWYRLETAGMAAMKKMIMIK